MPQSVRDSGRSKDVHGVDATNSRDGCAPLWQARPAATGIRGIHGFDTDYPEVGSGCFSDVMAGSPRFDARSKPWASLWLLFRQEGYPLKVPHQEIQVRLLRALLCFNPGEDLPYPCIPFGHGSLLASNATQLPSSTETATMTAEPSSKTPMVPSTGEARVLAPTMDRRPKIWRTAPLAREQAHLHLVQPV